MGGNLRKLSVRDLDVAGKRVLVRVDYNVPLDESLRVTDDRRIRSTLPTIRLLLERGAAVILASHFGRPKGKVVEDQRLAPAGRALEELLGRPVTILRDCIGDDVRARCRAAKPGDVILLDNLRFRDAEEKNDSAFARELASLGDAYVNDAFGAAHRAHASVSGVPQFLRPAAAGLLMAAEIGHLGGVLANPARPFVLVFGGAKVSDKVPVLENLLSRVDVALVGGGMAYTFLAARGVPVGGSRLEPDLVDTARRILAEAESRGVRIVLPSDHVHAAKLEPGAACDVSSPGVPEGRMGLDIGPATRAAYAAEIAKARTVLWNGPMGVFEMPPFDAGTRAVGDAIAAATANGAVTVVGGGDTAAAAEEFGIAGRMSHVSTGGGAALEFLEGRELPGVAALDPAPEDRP
ncbi:MAG: Bifunctional PGK/TIM [Planctomycetes bacterium]|nr:Bifunctional PGK/TIM [Planctomycetota bacterium]